MKIQRRHSGQSLVEFALVFPLIFFLISGFLDLGRAILYYSSLTNAVREGTRYAIVHKDEIIAAYDNPTDNSLQDKVLEYAFGLSGTQNPLTKEDIIIDIPDKVNNNFTTISIKAVYTFRPVTPGMKEVFGSSEGIDLIAQSKMLITPGSR